MAKMDLNFCIRNCAECENNIRCEECAYNKKSVELLVKTIQQNTAKDILQRWWREVKKGRNENEETEGTELWYIKKVAEEYGVEIEK